MRYLSGVLGYLMIGKSTILGRIASEELVKRSVLPEDTILSVNYIDTESQQLNQFRLEKRHKNIPKGKRQFWQSAFRYAESLGGGNLDEVMSQYRSQWIT